MSDLRSLLERADRAVSLVPLPPDGIEGLRKRRDRKRRNQRIAAGVVGIAVFVAAVWIVSSEGWLDRSETSVVPGTDVTGPTETGPTVAPNNPPDDYGFRIPPAGTAVSTPVEGELIAKAYPIPDYVRVYADGRVLSTQTFRDFTFTERRLSPEGVELVRSGAVKAKDLLLCPSGDQATCFPHDVPAEAWEDFEGKPYVPARYGACFWSVDIPLDVEAVLNLLPASAQALLRGSDPAGNLRCLEVTPEQARSLEEILSEALSSPGDHPPWQGEVGAWSLRDGNGDQSISLRPLFPDGHMFFHLPF
jgi:hypothetical protein